MRDSSHPKFRTWVRFPSPAPHGVSFVRNLEETPVQVREAFERYLKGLRADGAKRSTLTNYINSICPIVMLFGDREITSLTDDDITQFKLWWRAKNPADQTFYNNLSRLKAFLRPY